MTAVDTNVLVRIITNDDKAQAARATAFLREQNSVFIAKTVLLELEWVRRSAYRIERHEIVSMLRSLPGVTNAEVEDEAVVVQATDWYEKGMDFADSLHIASAGHKRRFVSFDTALRRKGRRLGVGEFAVI